MKDDGSPAGGQAGARRGAAATLADVARAAGVSTITASRALGNPAIVSAATVARVKAAAQRIGYVPNLLAGGLKSRRSRMVAVLVPTIAGSPFLRAVQALTEALSAAGYQVMLGQTGYDDSRTDALLDAIIGRRPDGIVVTGLVRSPEGRRRLLASGIPVVETWELSDQPLDMLVGLSQRAVGEACARYLWTRGRRRFAVATATDPRGRQRRDGFLQALRALAGAEGGALPAVLEHHADAPTTVTAGRQALAHLHRQDPALEAIYCNSDTLALGVLLEADSLGIAVPQQLAVLGYGDQELAAAANPGLSTVRVHDIEIGQAAARLVIARAEGRPAAAPVVDVGFSIIERGST